MDVPKARRRTVSVVWGEATKINPPQFFVRRGKVAVGRTITLKRAKFCSVHFRWVAVRYSNEVKVRVTGIDERGIIEAEYLGQ